MFKAPALAFLLLAGAAVPASAATDVAKVLADARGVVFLTADDADFITGSTLSINGGQHMY